MRAAPAHPHAPRWLLGLAAAGTGLVVLAGCTPANTADEAKKVRVHDIQGAGHLSPMRNAKVRDVPGVVTAVHKAGFWLQDSEPDDDPATSEAVYVFTKQTPDVAPGDAVEVSGTVTEFRPGNDAVNLSITEIERPEVTKSGTRELPAPVMLGDGENKIPDVVRADDPGDVERSKKFDPKANALDYYEALEGMRVRISDATSVGPSGDTLAVLPGDATEPRTERDGLLYDPDNVPTQRVILDDTITRLPTADVGDELPGDITGVLHYDFGNYVLAPTERPRVERRNLAREKAEPAGGDEVSVASFNVENLSPSDSDSKFERLAAVVKDNLGGPDILVVEEAQDNSGATDDGTVAADQTLNKLTTAITGAGGPRYEFRQINPGDNADGGEPGGNIRTAFLFRPDRVSFVDRAAGGANDAVAVIQQDGRPALNHSPGRVDPANPAFRDSRKPIVGEFTKGDRKLFVVAVHFKSKGGDSPVFGRYQPQRQSSESSRIAQAKAVRGFADKLFAADGDANLVVIGDFNDDYGGEAVRTMTDGGSLSNAADSLPANGRYSYVFEGVSSLLDQTVLSRSLFTGNRFRYDVVHVNAEFAQQISDHDPQLLRLRLG